MKFTKTALLFLILCFGFIIQSELFILDSWNFNTNSYYSCTVELSEQKSSIFVAQLTEECKKNNVEYFITDMQVISTYFNQLDIYCDDSVKQIISDNNKLSEGMYRSIGSGELYVQYNNVDKINNNIKISSASFIGNISDINSVVQTLRKAYDISYPFIDNANEKDVIYLVWFTIIALMFFITGIYVIYNKKNVIISTFFGADINIKIIMSMLEEIITDFFVFGLSHIFIFSFYNGEYMKKQVLICFSVGVLLSSLLYITYRFYDIGKVLKSNGDSFYLSKIITTIQIIIIVFISIGILTCKDKIVDNLLYDYEQTFSDTYSDYNLITFQGDNFYNYSKIEQLYINNFDKFKPVVCYKALEDDFGEYICINGYGQKQISNLLQEIQDGYEADILIFVPASNKENIPYENIKFCISQVISAESELNVKLITYESNQKIVYIDINASLNDTITHVAYNPVIIYCPTNTCISYKQYIKFPYGYNSVLLFGSKEEICSTFDNNNLNNYAVTNVCDHTKYYNNIKNKLLSIYSILILFSIIIHIILSIINATYYFHNNSRELCLKRITGYSFVSRYVIVFRRIVLKYILLTMIIMIIGNVISAISLSKIFCVLFILCLIEFVATIAETIHLENKNIVEIFKGRN